MLILGIFSDIFTKNIHIYCFLGKNYYFNNFLIF